MADLPAIRGVLAARANGFLGLSWRPRRLLDLNVLALLLGVVDELIREVVDLDVEGLPSAGMIQRSQMALRLSYERMRRERTRDHATLFRELGAVFESLGQILEELARLEQAGHLD